MFYNSAIKIILKSHSYENGNIINCLMIVKYYYQKNNVLETSNIEKKTKKTECPFVNAIWNTISNQSNKINEHLIKNKELRKHISLYDNDIKIEEEFNTPKSSYVD